MDARLTMAECPTLMSDDTLPILESSRRQLFLLYSLSSSSKDIKEDLSDNDPRDRENEDDEEDEFQITSFIDLIGLE